MKSDDIKLSYQMLYDFNKILDDNDIKYFLIGKTLLTIIKYKGIIPEKNNVSIGILKEDVGKILNISELIKKCDYTFKKTNKGYKLSKNNVSLILTIFKPFGKKYTIDNPLAKDDFPIKSYILKENLSPIKKLKIGELKVSVIRNYIPYLARNYPNYSKTREKVVKPSKIRKSTCMIENKLSRNEIMKKIPIEKRDKNKKFENKNCMSVYDNKKVISFYVNCDVHKKRKEKFLKHLKAAKGVKSCREPCVNGKAITRKLTCQMIDYGLVDKKADVNPIEIAIFLSHYNIWIKLLNSNAEYALVFEDDGEIHPNFKPMLDKTLKKLREKNKKFDILFLWNGNWNHTLKYAKKVLKIDKDISVIRETTDFTPGTVSYLITRKFAKKLARNSFPIKNSVDIYMGTQPFEGKESIPLSIKMTHDKKRECYLSPFFRGKDWICGGDWGTGDTTQNYDSEQILEIDCDRLKNIGQSTVSFKYNLGKKIGEGDSGYVYLIKDNPKIVCKIGDITDSEIKIQKEAAKLGISPGIVDEGFYGGKKFIIMERINGYTLEKYIVDLQKGGKLTKKDEEHIKLKVKKIFMKLYKSNLCHSDFHSDNIMYGKNMNRITEKKKFWIIDWGASFYKNPETNESAANCDSHSEKDCLKKSGCTYNIIRKFCLNRSCYDKYLEYGRGTGDTLTLNYD